MDLTVFKVPKYCQKMHTKNTFDDCLLLFWTSNTVKSIDRGPERVCVGMIPASPNKSECKGPKISMDLSVFEVQNRWSVKASCCQEIDGFYCG